jgi:tetratricopeptide (TPR) repeat protein
VAFVTCTPLAPLGTASLLWLVALVGGEARAQAPQSPEPATAPSASAPDASTEETVGAQGVESARQARDEFRAGVAHYQAGRYVEAIHSFQIAVSIIPSADLWFNIARAYEQLARSRGEISDWEQAIVHYRRYLTERVDPPDRAAVEATLLVLGERLDEARASLLTVATTGTLRVRAPQPGAVVAIDGEPVGETPLERDLQLSPGRHRVEASRDGDLPFLAEVAIEVGLPVTTPIELVPGRTHRSIRQSPVFAWVAWGLAAASLGTSVGLGVHAVSLVPETFDATRDQYSEARTWSATADAMLAATAGLTVLGVALFFVEGRAVETVTERGGVVEAP